MLYATVGTRLKNLTGGLIALELKVLAVLKLWHQHLQHAGCRVFRVARIYVLGAPKTYTPNHDASMV